MTAPSAASMLLERTARRAADGRGGGAGGSFPRTLLLAGPSEDRLDAEARRLAALLLCPGDDPRGTCDSCRRAGSGSHPDLFVAAPEGVQIKVDRVREALAFAAGRPYEGSRRVALVLHAEKLGVEAGNALLKSLEEPGAHLHWILTAAHPELLLPTILSRCTAVIVPAPSRAERETLWKERGFAEDEAQDLALIAAESEEAREDAAGVLSEYRASRERTLLALEAGLTGRRPAPLVLLAEELARAESSASTLLAELLADAAVAAGAGLDRIRHRAVGGMIAAVARLRSSEALRDAALCAADAPPDNRRGNRRLHYEGLLLELMGKG